MNWYFRPWGIYLISLWSFQPLIFNNHTKSRKWCLFRTTSISATPSMLCKLDNDQCGHSVKLLLFKFSALDLVQYSKDQTRLEYISLGLWWFYFIARTARTIPPISKVALGCSSLILISRAFQLEGMNLVGNPFQRFWQRGWLLYAHLLHPFSIQRAPEVQRSSFLRFPATRELWWV